MRISRVVIQNWRSVKDADFAPSDMTVLVGANNAGKTNILSAINFLLGDRWPMPGNLQDSDYFLGDRRRDIFIQLDFEDAPYRRIDFDTSRERYTMKAYDGRGYEFRGFNNEERARLAFAYVDASRNFDRQFVERSRRQRRYINGRILRTIDGAWDAPGCGPANRTA